MTEYAVSSGMLAEAIYVGRLNPKGDAFAVKQERTDMVLAAVAEFVQNHYAGGMTATFPGLGLELEVKVRPLVSTPRQTGGAR